MSAVTKTIFESMWYYRIAILWALFFTIQSIGSVILAGMVNTNWNELDQQGKFLLLVGMVVNWSGMMMAFLSRVVHRLAEEKPIMDLPESTQKKETTQ